MTKMVTEEEIELELADIGKEIYKINNRVGKVMRMVADFSKSKVKVK